MNSRALMQAEILLLLDQLHDWDIEETLAFVRHRASCSEGTSPCAPCDLATAAESCRLLLSMDKWERKGYLRWMKAKHPEAMLD